MVAGCGDHTKFAGAPLPNGLTLEFVQSPEFASIVRSDHSVVAWWDGRDWDPIDWNEFGIDSVAVSGDWVAGSVCNSRTSWFILNTATGRFFNGIHEDEFGERWRSLTGGGPIDLVSPEELPGFVGWSRDELVEHRIRKAS